MAKIPTPAEAEEIVKKYNKEPFHIQHAETVSGVMGVFAEKYDPERADYWRAVGMLHDVDYELYPELHCKKCLELLEAEGVDPALARSCASHGYGVCADIEPEQFMEKVLFSVDELTGLIGAAARMRPSHSCSDMELASLKKKFKDKKFAAGCSREVISRGAQMLGWDLDRLLSETLDAMKRVGD